MTESIARTLTMRLVALLAAASVLSLVGCRSRAFPQQLISRGDGAPVSSAIVIQSKDCESRLNDIKFMLANLPNVRLFVVGGKAALAPEAFRELVAAGYTDSILNISLADAKVAASGVVPTPFLVVSNAATNSVSLYGPPTDRGQLALQIRSVALMVTGDE
jgi:hypothetical protein